ncbi:hypothetical protein [Pilibacter termitis]|nr:hypothetical protein [Pilibacter termitis]
MKFVAESHGIYLLDTQFPVPLRPAIELQHFEKTRRKRNGNVVRI